jgi:hypothetical protein
MVHPSFPNPSAERVNSWVIFQLGTDFVGLLVRLPQIVLDLDLVVEVVSDGAVSVLSGKLRLLCLFDNVPFSAHLKCPLDWDLRKEVRDGEDGDE